MSLRLKSWFYLGSLYLVFLFLVLPMLFSRLEYGCLSAYDLGIFSQVLQAGWSFHWDPFIGIRESFLIQDHWDPFTNILGFVTAPLAGFVQAPRFLLWFEASTIFGAAVYLKKSLARFAVQERWVWLGFLMVLFSRPTWNAMMFPVHPSVWAVAFHAAFIVWAADLFLLKQKAKVGRLLLFTILIWICGEQFSLGLVTWAVALLILDRERRGLWFCYLVLVTIMAWWAMAGRIVIHNSLYDHGARVSLNPVVVWAKYSFDKDFYRRFIESLLGLSPALVVLWTRVQQGISQVQAAELKFLAVIFAFSLPLLAGRLLSNSWGSHYGILVTVTAAAVLFLARGIELKKSTFIWMATFMVLSTVGDWKRAFSVWMVPGVDGCSALEGTATAEIWAQRKRDIQSVAKAIPSGSRVLVGCFLAPALLAERSDLDVHTFGPFQHHDQKTPFDYVWLSLAPFENNWPVSDLIVQQVLLELSGQKVGNLTTSVLLKGPFEAMVFQKYLSEQKMKWRR